jgi:hypothetical protein
MPLDVKKGFDIRRATGDVRVDLSLDRKIRGTAIVFNSLSEDFGGLDAEPGGRRPRAVESR